MLVPAGSPIFFLREHRFAVRCRVVTLRQLFMDTVYAVIHVHCLDIGKISVFLLILLISYRGFGILIDLVVYR